jgi:hypothetical protein
MRELSSFRAALLGGLCLLALVSPLAAQEPAGFPLGALDVPAPQAVNPGQLVSLPAGTEDLLFSGETQKHTMLFVAEPGQLAGATDLYLTVQSAISVAPEWSQLSVAVNDQVIGTTALKAGEPYPLKWSVPAGMLQPGYNAVTFTVDQAHRVDCSVDATYELWTRIDPTQSGFAFAAGQPVAPDYTSLLAAVRTANGTTRLNGIINGAEGETEDALVAVFQTLAIGASIDRPDVDFSNAAGVGTGIDVITGPQGDVAGRLAATGSEIALAPGVNIGRRADGRLVLAIVAGTDADLDAALRTLGDGLQQAATGTAAGLAALERLKGVSFPADGKLTFAQLGVDGRDFGGRIFSQVVNFRLATDFYPADYAQAEINLDALYTSGLAPGAALQFKVNGRIVSTLNLSGSRNGEARDRRLPIALSAFRPGLNQLEVEATLPARMDAECAPGTTANNGRRLQLAGSSTIELPTLARIGRFPDLGALETSITGRDRSAGLTVVTPGTGSADTRAAATFLTRLAYAAGRAIPATFSSAMSLDEKSPLLVVAASGQLPADIRQNLPVDLAANPVAPTYEFATALPSEATTQPVRPADQLVNLPSVDMLTAEARAVFNDVRSSLYGLGMTVGLPVDGLRNQEGVGEAPVIGTDLLVAQTLNRSGTAPVTVLTAATSEQIAEALPGLVGAGWTRLDGSASALASTGEKLQAVKAQDVQYYPGGDSSLGNLRLVAAGWLSNTPSLYVMLVIVAALLLGLVTHILLVRTRRKL